ncbi:MAG TPA: PDZ domain-containing protein [Gemmata sp.]|nr:PDZ domain-containing protein [Gemmata sp.]
MFYSKRIVVALLAALVIAFTGSIAKADGIPLGIVVDETPKGIEVTQVLPGGIADRCMPRLRPGAYIITLNGFPVRSAVDFKRVIDSSTFVRFEFIDPKGESRWARAWSNGYAPSDAKPCCSIGVSSQAAILPPLVVPWTSNCHNFDFRCLR